MPRAERTIVGHILGVAVVIIHRDHPTPPLRVGVRVAFPPQMTGDGEQYLMEVRRGKFRGRVLWHAGQNDGDSRPMANQYITTAHHLDHYTVIERTASEARREPEPRRRDPGQVQAGSPPPPEGRPPPTGSPDPPAAQGGQGGPARGLEGPPEAGHQQT